jgi:hypothetical protein
MAAYLFVDKELEFSIEMKRYNKTIRQPGLKT